MQRKLYGEIFEAQLSEINCGLRITDYGLKKVNSEEFNMISMKYTYLIVCVMLSTALNAQIVKDRIGYVNGQECDRIEYNELGVIQKRTENNYNSHCERSDTIVENFNFNGQRVELVSKSFRTLFQYDSISKLCINQTSICEFKTEKIRFEYRFKKDTIKEIIGYDENGLCSRTSYKQNGKKRIDKDRVFKYVTKYSSKHLQVKQTMKVLNSNKKKSITCMYYNSKNQLIKIKNKVNGKIWQVSNLTYQKDLLHQKSIHNIKNNCNYLITYNYHYF